MKKTFQTHIIQRFLADNKLDEFLDVYNGSRIHAGREGRQVSPVDRLIYADAKNGMKIQQLAIKYNRSYSWIHKAITLASVEEKQS